MKTFMLTEVKIGQQWAAWMAGRQQWLLTTVTAMDLGRATLQYSPSYGLERADSERDVDAATMLTAPNLFRFVRCGS
jgi:hypothetical protein